MLTPDPALPVFQPPAQATATPHELAGALWVARPYDGGPHDEAGCLPLPHRPEAGRQARRTAQGRLERWQVPAETADDVLLVVSELVTNALNHALPSVCMHLTRLPSGVVRVEVADGGPCGTRLERDPDAGGRGLALVEALARSHGRAACPAGALAWAEFAAPTAALDLPAQGLPVQSLPVQSPGHRPLG